MGHTDKVRADRIVVTHSGTGGFVRRSEPFAGSKTRFKHPNPLARRLRSKKPLSLPCVMMCMKSSCSSLQTSYAKLSLSSSASPRRLRSPSRAHDRAPRVMHRWRAGLSQCVCAGQAASSLWSSLNSETLPTSLRVTRRPVFKLGAPLKKALNVKWLRPRVQFPQKVVVMIRPR